MAIDPSKYIVPSPDLASMLTQLRLGGKQVFLQTLTLIQTSDLPVALALTFTQLSLGGIAGLPTDQLALRLHTGVCP